MHAIEMYRNKVVFNKPMYVGSCILDLSKHHMVNFHYNHMMKHFPECQLLYTDTDSLVYNVKQDIYAHMDNHQEIFDTGKENSGTIGLFKNDTANIKEWLALSSKCYNYTTKERACEKNKSKCKGVMHSIQAMLTKDIYENTLTTGDQFPKTKEDQDKFAALAIRSHNHNLVTMEIRKVVLSAKEDKLYRPDYNSGFPYGYKNM